MFIIIICHKSARYEHKQPIIGFKFTPLCNPTRPETKSKRCERPNDSFVLKALRWLVDPIGITRWVEVWLRHGERCLRTDHTSRVSRYSCKRAPVSLSSRSDSSESTILSKNYVENKRHWLSLLLYCPSLWIVCSFAE